MAEWLDKLSEVTGAGEDAVLVTVAHVRGSAPREAGAHIIVTKTRILETIGGGNLEFKAIDKAREILGSIGDAVCVKDYPLGPALGQCCGGVVTLTYEPVRASGTGWLVSHEALVAEGRKFISVVDLDGHRGRQAVPADSSAKDKVSIMMEPSIMKTAYRVMQSNPVEKNNLIVEDKTGKRYLVETMEDQRQPLFLFGAGHVGRALVHMLEGLPFRITWVDSRADQFPEALQGIETLVAEQPETAVAKAPKGAFYLVMTHDHGQDLEITAAILERGDAAYAGVIGSDTKRARFEKRLKERGINLNKIDNLVCPIGIDGITGKRPVEVALAVAAEMQITYEALSAGNREDECESNREITE
ncbi:xanthine dehydrogenase accessory protein XdhC [Aestuariispira insulae]|uniref:Xanthine dehydrogenase accessory factor n=1 Tax=Aestuariispira insulae TaxID=1461337 RepID=A0A3D9HWJ9_9PROT|nr:xanthine dehydrogenase accessory protein XdhC [Aestuariispira insulae]RED53857.1 xanthine dehydrogenase accessory factor [Aestuariispira insulae]